MDELREVRVNGLTLSYADVGAGEPVVLVHGLPNDYRAWRHQMEAMRSRYRVIAYNRRCAYPNHNPEGLDDGVPSNSDDLAALIEELKLGSVHLVGHSYGGFVSLYCAFRRPDLVRTMVLCEPAAISLLITNPNNPLAQLGLFFRDREGARALLQFANSTARPAQRAFRRGDLGAAASAFVDGLGGRGAYGRLPEDLKQMVLENVGYSVRALGAKVPSFTAADARKIATPTLLVRGDETQPFFSHVSILLSRSLRNSSEVVIRGAHHLVPIEKPAEFNAAALDFLSKAS